jgi:hypothetical protein
MPSHPICLYGNLNECTSSWSVSDVQVRTSLVLQIYIVQNIIGFIIPYNFCLSPCNLPQDTCSHESCFWLLIIFQSLGLFRFLVHPQHTSNNQRAFEMPRSTFFPGKHFERPCGPMQGRKCWVIVHGVLARNMGGESTTLGSKRATAIRGQHPSPRYSALPLANPKQIC